MANTKSALKMIRVAGKRRLRNRSTRSAVKTFLTKAEKTISSGEAEAPEVVQRAISAIDKAAEKGVIHKNNAARHKSRLMKKLNHTSATR